MKIAIAVLLLCGTTCWGQETSQQTISQPPHPFLSDGYITTYSEYDKPKTYFVQSETLSSNFTVDSDGSSNSTFVINEQYGPLLICKDTPQRCEITEGHTLDEVIAAVQKALKENGAAYQAEIDAQKAKIRYLCKVAKTSLELNESYRRAIKDVEAITRLKPNTLPKTGDTYGSRPQ